MAIARDLATLRREVAALRRRAGSVALVPTMGALHPGHLSLIALARQAAGAVVASIFVNPLQFGPAEDLSRYPRDEAGDLAALRDAGCDLAWLPTPEAMYPPGSATTVEVAGLSDPWEGVQRPGHFRGVATVCAKLFLQTGADVAVFGEKDWQQLAVIRRMVRDLDLPIRILPGPTVREADGLAMSSRNRFLSPAERAAAALLPATLQELAAGLRSGAPAAPRIGAAEARLRQGGLLPDYLALIEGETLQPLEAAPGDGSARLLVAARLGTVRLLDNLAV
jgi:pantoate--beta-alanine ligase